MSSTEFRPYVTPSRGACASSPCRIAATAIGGALGFIVFVLSAYGVSEVRSIRRALNARPYLTLNHVVEGRRGASLYRGAGSWHDQRGLDRRAGSDFGVSDWQAVSGDHGKIYLFGGLDTTNPPNTLQETWEYDVIRQAYTRKANMTSPRSQFGAGALTDASTGRVTKIVIAAGLNAGAGVSTSEFYNVASDTFTSGPALMQGHLDGCMASTGDAVYMIGGWTSDMYDSMSKKVEKLSRDVSSWSAVADLPHELGDCAAAGLNGKVYVAGGYYSDGTCEDCFQNHLFEYNPATNTWTQKASMKYRRGDLQLVAREGRLLAIGGEIAHVQSDGAVKDKVASHYVEEYIPEMDRWELRQPLGDARFRFAAATSEWGTHVFGGSEVCATPTGNWSECFGYQLTSHEVYFELDHPNVWVNVDPAHEF